MRGIELLSAFIIDTAMTMAWCFEDEATDATDAVLDRLRDVQAAVPAIWPLEFATHGTAPSALANPRSAIGRSGQQRRRPTDHRAVNCQTPPTTRQDRAISLSTDRGCPGWSRAAPAFDDRRSPTGAPGSIAVQT
ncbi:MAG: hypothetical protein QOG99_995 [Frankiales bacterium]|nr:hypothetical protein [Frankiales bacterium]